MRQQRCGFNPLFNDSCHTFDGRLVLSGKDDGKKVDVTGGWHDASDYLQYLSTSANAVYQMLSQYYIDSKDTANYVATLEKGLEKFPQEFYFLGNLINHYVFGGQPQKATELLDKAIANDPNNAQLYSVRGSMLEVLEDIDGAMANFDKAIELKPNFKDAWLGKARLIYNKAFKMEQKALEIRDFKLSDQEVAKALEVYKESIPFFEKVIEIDSEDYETMKTLRSLFYKLTNSDSSYQAKYDEINKKMLGY